MLALLYYYYYYYYYSALRPVWAGTRAQSGDRYGFGTLHPGQVLRGSLPFLSPSLVIYIYIYIYSSNIPPIIIINRIYETQNLLSL